MFGLVSQRKYDKLDKQNVLLCKEINDLKKSSIIMKQSDVDIMMSDMKRLETDNKYLREKLKKYEEVIDKIFRLTDECTSKIDEYQGINTTAYWIKEEGKPFICSKCGYSFWNGTDHYVTHCSGCGRRMEKIVTDIIKE